MHPARIVDLQVTEREAVPDRESPAPQPVVVHAIKVMVDGPPAQLDQLHHQDTEIAVEYPGLP